MVDVSELFDQFSGLEVGFPGFIVDENSTSKSAVSVILAGTDHLFSCGYLPSDEKILVDAHNIAVPSGIDSDQPSVVGLGEL